MHLQLRYVQCTIYIGGLCPSILTSSETIILSGSGGLLACLEIPRAFDFSVSIHIQGSQRLSLLENLVAKRYNESLGGVQMELAGILSARAEEPSPCPVQSNTTVTRTMNGSPLPGLMQSFRQAR